MGFGSGGHDRDDTSVFGIVIPQFVLNRRGRAGSVDRDQGEVHWLTCPGIDGHPHGVRCCVCVNGIYPNLPAKWDCVGRVYFARAPGGDMWVEFGDLPETTWKALQESETFEAAADRTKRANQIEKETEGDLGDVPF